MSVPKINSDTYVGNTGKQLKDIKTNADNISTNASNITTLNNSMNRIGTIYNATKTNIAVNANSSNVICSITLQPGTYVIVGTFKYQGSDLRYYLTLYSRSLSVYDNAGYVEGSISDILYIDRQTTINLYLWPSKSFTVSNTDIRAVRIR